MKTITVLAFQSWQDFHNQSGAVAESTFDTLREARARARYYLTDAFQASGELAAPLHYSQVLVDGECVSDYFRQS